MLKRKAGLQKEVSRIFTGIQIPRKDATEGGPCPAAPQPVAPKPAASQPAAPAPAKRVEPKTIPAIPRVFTIPEPEQHTQPTPAAAPKVTEPAAPVQKVYEPPAQKVYEPPPVPVQKVYEPPAPTSAAARQPRPEIVSVSHIKIPGLKILEKLKNKLLSPKSGASPVKQKVMIVMIPVLLVVFIVVLTRMLRTPGKSSATATKNAAAGAVAVFDGKIDWELPASYPENFRDAMIFGVKPKTQEDEKEENANRPAVKGIVFSEDNPCAVVGDRIVSVGDVVQGATVVKINPDGVEFTRGEESWTQKVER